MDKVTLFLAALLVTMGGAATGQVRPGGRAAETMPNVFHLKVPAHPLDVIVARPEAHAMTLSVLAYDDMEALISWGATGEAVQAEVPAVALKKGEPKAVLLSGLQADTEYVYSIRMHKPGRDAWERGPAGRFHTARAAGATFTFSLSADVHLDDKTRASVYEQTLANIRGDKPDFHLDLGNLFMTDKHATREEAEAQYVAQRYYLAQTGAPLLLSLGTHDGEAARYDDGTADCMAVWSNVLRRKYFPNPVPDEFYTGNSAKAPHRGLVENYYAWNWGGAHFIVLDAFAYTMRDASRKDGWAWTLGKTQYRWLTETLEKSTARHKFVVIHNLLCGDQAARGGVEVAHLNEWGGKNADGSEGFAAHRPGWEMPVHALLVKHGVTAVLKAHDNFYARQELDGIVYLMVPQPSFAGNDRIRDLETYGYKKGVFLGNSGHVRVTVAPERVRMEYVRARDGAVMDAGEVK